MKTARKSLEAELRARRPVTREPPSDALRNDAHAAQQPAAVGEPSSADDGDRELTDAELEFLDFLARVAVRDALAQTCSPQPTNITKEKKQ